jgi:DNA mismatch repair protein MutS2
MAEALAASHQKTLDDLEWGRIVDAVAGRCTGPLRERLDVLLPATSYEEARTSLAETKEALDLMEADEPLPLDGIREVRRSLDRVERSGALDGPALRDIASTLGAARVLRKFLSRRRDRAPALYLSCSTDPTLDDVIEALERAIERDGTLSDSASPDLGRLRGEVSALRARIVARLEALLSEHDDVVQDRFHTLREGRYVIPVRTDAHEKVPGIVHGTSGSGATVFVEPRAIVVQGNRLKIAQGELEREEARILGVLSGHVRDRVEEVRAAVDALDRADLRNASARLARDLRGTVPELDPRPSIRLIDARHPLLALEGVEVVPNDLSLEAGHCLVLSGPNAGGKTVALKVLGLASLMVRAGLPLPAAEGSRAGFFTPILSDVGDEQSIEKNLSTFSAHVTNLVRVLDEAGPSAMVLLDEVATGTDPEEGAALACALVDAVCSAGAAMAVTTHYERLKAMAATDPRLANASVGFDVARMEPTFRVRPDVPGASSALAVAQRFGIPAAVIESARAMLSDETRTFDALVRKLEARFEELEVERRAAASERYAAEQARIKADEALEAIRKRDRAKLSEEGERLLSSLRDARGELKDARRALRDKERHDEASLAKIRVEIDRVAERVDTELDVARESTPEPERGEPIAEREISLGSRVYVPRLRSEVDVIEGPTKGRIRVAAGPLKLWVLVDEVRRPQPAAAAPSARSSAEARPASKPMLRLEAPNDRNTVDVRGMRVDDALALTETFLDRVFGSGEPVAYILHGVGTGALRDAIREHLAHLGRYVASSRAGTLEEGGERVTVVALR